MMDKTIDSALLNLRKQIIRGKLDGLAHVDALLIARGVDPALQHVRRKMPRDSCKQREVKRLVLEALREGPKRPAEIGAHFMAEKTGIPRERAMIRVYRAIYKMRDSGAVGKDGRAWRLVQTVSC